MRFRPTLWATLSTAVALAILIGLGTWQLHRLDWKRDLIETRAARITMTPLTIDEAVDAGRTGEIAEMEYRPVTMRGRYQHEWALRLQNRVREGAPGIHLISPFRPESGDTVVLVDRGWMPIDASLDMAERPEGIVEVDGYIRLYGEPGAFVPENEPGNNIWFTMDDSQMRQATEVGGNLDFYVQAGPGSQPRDRLPVGTVPGVELRNDHLQYAVTWYSLAAVLLVIYVIFHLRRHRNHG